jgi:hypothetical protein
LGLPQFRQLLNATDPSLLLDEEYLGDEIRKDMGKDFDKSSSKLQIFKHLLEHYQGFSL